MTKILFLDIDGVLNCARTCLAFGGFPHGFDGERLPRIDPVALALVRRACEETGARIVLSSSWRLIHDWSALGAALELPIIDRTPDGGTVLSPGGVEFHVANGRGMEINAWMSANGIPERYAILDDDSDMLPNQMPHFVQTSFEDGMQLKHYKRLIELL